MVERLLTLYRVRSTVVSAAAARIALSVLTILQQCWSPQLPFHQCPARRQVAAGESNFFILHK